MPPSIIFWVKDLSRKGKMTMKIEFHNRHGEIFGKNLQPDYDTNEDSISTTWVDRKTSGATNRDVPTLIGSPTLSIEVLISNEKTTPTDQEICAECESSGYQEDINGRNHTDETVWQKGSYATD